MEYVSTRGQGDSHNFSEIVFKGFADDGGLWVPKKIPQIDRATLKMWRGLPYASLAFEIIHLFAGEIPRQDLWKLCASVYQQANFPHARDPFSVDDIASIKWLEDSVGLLELAHGPTLSVDDIGMMLLSRLFDMNITESHPTTLVGATTGDMGISAAEAFGNHKNIDIVLLSPKGRMSKFQAAQLYSNDAPNVTNIEVEGTYDDCQELVFKILKDREFAGRLDLGALNSVLWARVLTQIVYFFYGYLRAVSSVDEEVCFVMPSGNLCNAYACWLAKEMGLPIMRIILATNENDTIDTFLRTGHYAPKKSGATLPTSSPSTDISRAASLERFLFEMFGHDGRRVAELKKELEEKGEFRLTKEEIRLMRSSCLISGSSNHANRLEIIESMNLEFDTFVDPHTADALFCGIYLHPVGVKTLVCETVQAVKFPTLIKQATGHDVVPPQGMESVLLKPKRSTKLPLSEELLREALETVVRMKKQEKQ